jgi:pimeloyl-ACP methyl ester carboxylesterase
VTGLRRHIQRPRGAHEAVRSATALLALVLAVACSQSAVKVDSGTKAGSYTGAIGAAAYQVDVPAKWNGTLLLYSHGYAAPTGGNPASDAGDATTKGWLLENGYALAGSSYSGTGWALADAFQDQVALLGVFAKKFGKPRRTVAWGHSLGGIITAGLVQLHPELFAGALPMCGVLAGGIANWNGALDIGFATQVLLDPQLQVVNIADPGANLARARAAVTAANTTPQGKARLALIAALGYLPGWFNPLNPEPPADDFATQQANQATWESFDFAYIFAFRAELEKRAGGNPSWNTGVDYQKAFAASPVRAEAEALYQQAGLDLAADLARVQAAPRISADRAAVAYLEKNISFNGSLAVPVLTLHTTGDGLVVVENEAAYADVVAAGPDGGMLRQLFVHRANHCIFTPAEQIAAFQVLFNRLDGGSWGTTEAASLNERAAALGAKYNGDQLPGSASPITVAAAFVAYAPPAFPRQFDSRSLEP